MLFSFIFPANVICLCFSARVLWISVLASNCKVALAGLVWRLLPPATHSHLASLAKNIDSPLSEVVPWRRIKTSLNAIPLLSFIAAAQKVCHHSSMQIHMYKYIYHMLPFHLKQIKMCDCLNRYSSSILILFIKHFRSVLDWPEHFKALGREVIFS